MIKLTYCEGKGYWVNPNWIIDMEVYKDNNGEGNEYTKLAISSGGNYFFKNIKETPEEIRNTILFYQRNSRS